MEEEELEVDALACKESRIGTGAQPPRAPFIGAARWWKLCLGDAGKGEWICGVSSRAGRVTSGSERRGPRSPKAGRRRDVDPSSSSRRPTGSVRLACGRVGHVKARCARDIHRPAPKGETIPDFSTGSGGPAAFREAPHVPAHSRPHRGYMERKGCGAVSPCRGEQGPRRARFSGGGPPVLLWSRGRSCVALGHGVCCG